jgi:hypothetical protein
MAARRQRRSASELLALDAAQRTREVPEPPAVPAVEDPGPAPGDSNDDAVTDPQPGRAAAPADDLTQPVDEATPDEGEPARVGTRTATRQRTSRSSRPERRRPTASSSPQEPTVATKVSLPRWLNDQVRDLWATEGASFAELIDEALEAVDALGPSDPARVPSAAEVKDWKRQLRLHPGSDPRTLRLSPEVTGKVQGLVDAAGAELGFSTMVAMLLSRHHPSIKPPQSERPAASSA